MGPIASFPTSCPIRVPKVPDVASLQVTKAKDNRGPTDGSFQNGFDTHSFIKRQS